MTAVGVSRRAFAIATGLIMTGFSDAARAAPNDDLGISGGADTIHQEVVFKASPARVYSLLTRARLFDKVVLLSGALEAYKLRATPSKIGAKEGDAFALFGGYVTGRQIELTPNTRIIQAWRAGSWAPHIYSIVRFELAAHPDGCKLVFDHTGFPVEEARSLASGWRTNYWAAMTKALATSS